MLTIFTVLVVRCVNNMVSFPHMGRGIRSRYDAAGYLEWDECPSVLCQTLPDASERSDLGDGDERNWGPSGKGWSGS